MYLERAHPAFLTTLVVLVFKKIIIFYFSPIYSFLGITDTNTLESIQNQNENHFEFLDDSLTDLSSEVKTLRYLSEISFII